MRKERFLLVGATRTVGCQYCCEHERFLDSLKKAYFRNESAELSKYKVKIGRVDVASDDWFLELHPELKETPNFVFYANGEPFYVFDSFYPSFLIPNIIRLVEPFIEIGSLNLFEQYLNKSNKDMSGRNTIKDKIFGLFADPEDYEGSIQELENLSREAFKRRDAIFAICRKASVVKEIYARYGRKFFLNSFDKNTIVFLKMRNRFQYKEKISIMDFDRSNNIKRWITEASRPVLDEMTPLNQETFSSAIPLAVAFIDPEKEVESQRFLDDLTPVALKYLERVNFVWVDYRDNLALMREIGLEGHK